MSAPQLASVRTATQSDFREQVLHAARRFKSSWVEMGRLLTRVRAEGLFEGWGYSSFERYCAEELHIRKQTALKLTRSADFVERHEPEAARAPDFTERAPAFEVIDLLADAESRGQLSADEYRSVRDSIWDGQKPASALRRELSSRFPKPPPEPPDLERLVSAARKLARELATSRHVPSAVAERAEALVGDLEALSVEVKSAC